MPLNQTSHIPRDALSAYIDSELPADRLCDVAEHLTVCAQCSAEYQDLLDTVAALGSNLQRHTAPDVLRARIRTMIATTPGEPDATMTPGIERARRWNPGTLGLAATLVVAAALGSGVTFVALHRGSSAPPIMTEVLASHVRSLMPDHLTDIRSSDQHNVKPWFNGRVDYSPAVPRFEEQGFPLVGGRVDYVGGRPVAVVVYSRRQHIINVFSWPARLGDAAMATTSANGYTMLRWRSGGIERWVVSDLNAAELNGFARLLISS